MVRERKIFEVSQLTDGDVNSLAEFLKSNSDDIERQFHNLLEEHPSLMGVLGYVKFLSELTVPRMSPDDKFKPRKDRLDILAGRSSEVDSDKIYADIIELKRPNRAISQSNDSRRLSKITGSAISQLKSYEYDLLRNQELGKELASVFGMEIVKPRKILISGRDSEFAHRPGDYELVKSQFHEQGIYHYTLDKLLILADNMRNKNLGTHIYKAVPQNHFKLLVTEVGNWKLSVIDKNIIAEPFSQISDLNNPVLWYYSCFISYSSKDTEIAERLYADMIAKGIRVWFFPESAKMGRDVWGEIDQAIRVYDKMIVLCSKNSLRSGPVIREIERALQMEDDHMAKHGKPKSVLFPIRLDNYIIKEWEHPRKTDVVNKYVLGDFRGCKSNMNKYNDALDKLIKALESED